MWRPKPCLLMLLFFTLDGFRLLLSTQLTVDLTPEGRCGSMFHPLLHILCKISFLLRWNSCKQYSESSTCCCFWSTVSKHSTAKWWIHCLLISSTPLLSHATSIYDWPKLVCGVFFFFFFFFFVFSETTAEFGWPHCSALFVSVWLCWQSAVNLLTVVSNGAETE